MALLQQILGSIAMIFGVAVGEILSLRVFGKVKNTILGLIDMIVFIVSLNWIFSQTSVISSLFPYLSYALYFSFSFLLIFFIRGVTTLGGIRGEATIEEKIDKTTKKVIEAMLKAGFTKSRILKIMKEAGFDKTLVEDKLSTIKEEDYIPTPLEKLDKIEKDLEKIKEKVS